MVNVQNAKHIMENVVIKLIVENKAHYLSPLKFDTLAEYILDKINK